MSSFDAHAYLQQLGITPSSVKSLTGGVVNETFRVGIDEPSSSPSSTTSRPSWCTDRGTVILKYAPPYIARIGPEAPFDVRRQKIEATALRLFSQAGQAQPGLKALTRGSIVTPRLLWHDADRHVLIMTDLGTLPDLSDVFSDLGGRIPGDRVLASPSRHLHWDGKFFQELGGRLGSFFATLHSPQILEEARSLLESDAELVNTSAREVVLDGAIKPVGDHLRRFPDLISVDEVEQLLAALTEDFWRSNEANEESLVLGDCWTGAALAAPAHTADPESTIKVGVIDWEFASIGRGAHGDMAQFLAHLELLSISASQSPDFNSHHAAVQSLIESIIRSYRETSTHPVTRADYARNPTAQALRTKAVRSALLSHGAEIINNTFWKQWRCVETACPRAAAAGGGVGDDLHALDASRVHECVLIRRMVERGLDYLRAGYHHQLLLPRSRSPGVDLHVDNDDKAQRFWLLDLFWSTDDLTMLAKVITPSLQAGGASP